MFVYDDESLPDGKSNLRALAGDPDKYVTAEEWNTVMQAIIDLRTAILTGEYHGLASTPAALESGAGETRLRNNAGILQVSEDEDIYRSVGGFAEIHVRDYGAVGDGVTDDTSAIQAAFTAANDRRTVVLDGSKTYLVSDTLRLGDGDGARVNLDGRGAIIRRSAGSALPQWGAGQVYVTGDKVIHYEIAYVCETGGTSGATGPTGYTDPLDEEDPGIADGTVIWYSTTDAVIEVVHNVATIRNVYIEAAREASYGFWIETGTRTILENCDVYQSLVDGYKLFSNSDFVMLVGCTARLSGRIWTTSGYNGPATAQLKTTVTGVFAKTSGINCVLTYTPSGGSPIADLRDLGLRRGDFISLHAATPGDTSAEWLQVGTIDSATQITCSQYPASGGAASNLQFSIHRGDGFHTGPGRAENNCHTFDTCRSDNSSGAGFLLGGLYGPRCRNLFVNAACSHPIVVATSSYQVIGTSIHGFYTEEGINGASNNVFCGGAAGITIDTTNTTGMPIVAAEGFSWGVVTNRQNAGDVGRIDPIDITSTRSYVPAARIFQNAHMKGPLYGRSYASAETAGGGIIDVDDRDYNGAFRLTSGAETGGGRAYSTNCFEFDTTTAVVNGVVAAAWTADTSYTGQKRIQNGGELYELVTPGVSASSGGPSGTGAGIVDGTCVWDWIETSDGANTDLPRKSLVRYAVTGTPVGGVGLGGDLRMAVDDSSGTPGNATISAPAGRFAMDASATTVVITNALVAATSKVFLSKLDLDATAVDFKVECVRGSFTVTANAAATAAVVFDFFVVNEVNQPE